MEEGLVLKVLDQVAKDSLATGRPSPGRLATIQAMVDLGNDWHKYTEVAKRMKHYVSSGGIYSYELVRKYPDVFEKGPHNVVRIKPEAYDFMAQNIPKRMRAVFGTKPRPKT
jgi:hypothetical protein